MCPSPSRNDETLPGNATEEENAANPAQPSWTLELFVAYHRTQLETSAVPEHFWPTLYDKLVHQVGALHVKQVYRI